MEYAEKLTRTPWEMTPRDLSRLRAQGLGDEEITDATQIIGYFNYINRLADALGCPLEDFMEPAARKR